MPHTSDKNEDGRSATVNKHLRRSKYSNAKDKTNQRETSFSNLIQAQTVSPSKVRSTIDTSPSIHKVSTSKSSHDKSSSIVHSTQ